MPPSEPNGAERRRARVFAYASVAPGAARDAFVAVEAPVALEFGGQPHAVMMATPADLVDFATGFALTEGVVDTVDDIRGVETVESAEGWTLKLALAGPRLADHLARRRALVGRTSCGLCGVEDFAALPRPRRVAPVAPIAPESVKAALRAFDGRQTLNGLTHAVHGAAWFDRQGALVALREDVGRHNALDKLIGALARARVEPSDGFFIVSSRCSFEMVAKAARFGAALLVSLSAPTTLALDEAERLGVAVVAVARADHALTFEIEKTDEDAA